MDESWEEKFKNDLKEAGRNNFDASSSDEAIDNIAEPIIVAIKEGSGGSQTQSDWAESNPQNPAFIKNKPNIPQDVPSRQEMAAAIGAETSRATAAEASLQTQINGKASQSALDAEIARAQDAESALGTRIDGVEDDVEALDTRLTTAEGDIDNLESSVDALYNTEVEQTDGETSVSSSTSGKVKTFVVGLASAIKTKIEAAYSHISDAVKHITATERTNWNTAYTHSQTEGNPHGTTIEEIDGLRTELTTIESDVSAIEGVIPSEATTTNQLADKSFVNSSISSQTAYFRGTFDIVTDLGLTHGASNTAIATALASVVSVVTPNDYTFVIDQDTDGNTLYKRFKYSGSVWQYEYTLNNSSFTAAQWAAIQSGITAEDVADIGYNTTARHTHTNKNLLDTYTESNASLADAVAKKHEHANKTILDNTTASYTSEEKTKLAGIESGAEVNVNADWNATSGDAKILNKPSTFPPSSHTHSIANVTGLQSALDGKIDKTGLEYTSGENLAYQLFTSGSPNTSATDGGKSITISPENSDTYFRIKYADNIAKDEEITISFDVEYNGDDDGNWLWNWSFYVPIVPIRGSGHYICSGKYTGTRTKDTVQIVADDGNRTILPVNSFKIKNIKIERGSIATGFCLCPAEQRAATLTTPRSIQTDLGSTAAPTFDGSANITPGIKGTLPIPRGGTGATTEKAARYNLFNDTNLEDPLSVGDDTLFAGVYINQSTSNGSLYKAKWKYIWSYIANKISSVLGLTSSNYNGKAATAGTADKATTDTDGNNIADTFGILNDYYDRLHGARRYINYGTRSWDNTTFLNTAYVGKEDNWNSTSYTGDVTMIEVGDVLVLDVENTSLGSNGKYAHFLLFIKVTAKSTTSPTGVVIACVHSNEQATLDVTNVSAKNFIIPGIYNLFGCATANNWGTNGRTSVIVTAGTNGGAALSTNNAFIEQTMSGTNTRHIRTCSDGTWSSWISSPKTAGVSSSGEASSYTFNGSSSSMFVSYNGTASVSIQVGNLAENVLYSIYSCALSSTSRALNISFVKGSLSSNFNLYGHGLNGTSHSSYTLTTTQGSNDGVLHFVRNGNRIYLMEY